MINKVRSKLNCIQFSPSPAEGDAHFRMKCDICRYLKQEGLDFYKEVYFVSPHKGRADIVVCSNPKVIIEIIDSEKELKEHKRENYPPLEIISVSANQKFSPSLLQ